MWARIERFARSAWTILRATGEGYGNDKCSLIAAALAFYAFLSIFPLLIVAVAVFALLGPPSERLMHLLGQQIVQSVPGAEIFVNEQIVRITRHSVSVGSLAFVGLLWSASQAFSTLQTALQSIWEVPARGPVAHLLFNRLRALAMVLLAVIFLLISLGVISAIEALKHASAFSLRLGPLPSFWESLLWAVSFVSTVVMFLTIYGMVPKPRIRLRDVAFCAVLVAVLWEAAKRGFAFYVTRAAPSNAVYGFLGTVVLTLLWAYWSATILLFGAELAWAMSKHARGELPARD
jgi:membrane protein